METTKQAGFMLLGNRILRRILFGIILIWTGCTWDEITPDKINGIHDWSPEFVIPLANSELTVWDLAGYADEADSHVNKDSTGLLHVYISGANIATISSSDMMNLPSGIESGKVLKEIGNIRLNDFKSKENTLTLDKISGLKGTPDFQSLQGTEVPFPPVNYQGGNDSPEFTETLGEFNYIQVHHGWIEFYCTNQLEVPVSFEIQLIDKGNNNNELFSFIGNNIQGDSTWIDSVEITDRYVTNNLIFKLKEISSPGSNEPVLIDIHKGLFFFSRFSDLIIIDGEIVTNNQYIENITGIIEVPVQDYKLRKLKLNSGLLSVSIDSDIQGLNGEIELQFPSIQINENPLRLNVPITNSQGKNTVSLSNSIFELGGDSDNEFNLLSYGINLWIDTENQAISIHSTDHISLMVEIKSPELKYALGDFGQQKITVSEGTFNEVIDFESLIDGHINLLDPTFLLTTENSFGIPVKAEFQFIGKSKKGASVELNPSSFCPAYSETPDIGMVSDTFKITKQNSRIVDFTNLPPDDRIDYFGVIELNPSGTPGEENLNWISDTSKCRVHFDTDIPLVFQTGKVGYRDTFAYNIEWPDDFEDYSVNFYSRNEIPVDIEVELNILDAQKKVIATPVQSLILQGGVASEDGVSLKQGEKVVQIEMSEKNNEAIKNGKYISFSGILRSQNNGQEGTRIYAGQKLEIRLSMNTKVNFSE